MNHLFTRLSPLLAALALAACASGGDDYQNETAYEQPAHVAPAAMQLEPVYAAPLAEPVSRTSGPEFKWEHFGGDPYAASREEAMRTRESAFRKLGLPSEVAKLLLEATQRPGEYTTINVGDHLDAMLSRGGVVHKNVLVAFVTPKPHMQYAAPAEKWSVTWQGKTYTVILPEICNNWSAVFEAKTQGCAEIRLMTHPGDVGIHFALLGDYAPSACFALKGPGDAEWRPLPTRCPDAACDFQAVVMAVGLPLSQSGGWPVPVPGEYVVRVSSAFARNIQDAAVFCLTQASGRGSCGKDIHPRDYTEGVAFIVYDPAEVSRSSWHGTPRVWTFDGSCNDER